MSEWASNLTNPEALSLYRTPPSLRGVELLKLRSEHGLDVVLLDLSISEMPREKPERWPAEANAVALTLEFSDVLASSMTTAHSGSDDVIVNCSFRKAERGFLFDCDGKSFNFRAECNYVRVKSLSGYTRSHEKESV